MSTLFTRIIAGDIPSYRIYEDAYVYALLDIYPRRLGHTLIVPKIEIDHFADIPEPYYSAIFQAAQKISKAIEQATGCSRVCALFAGYEIPHCHYHLIPTDSMADLDPVTPSLADPESLRHMQTQILGFLS